MSISTRITTLCCALIAASTAITAAQMPPTDSIVPAAGSASYTLNWETDITATGSSGDFAPYYIASNNHGVITQANNLQARASLWRDLDLDSRFSYALGADLVAGASSGIDYYRFNSSLQLWHTHSMHASTIWLQQLYAVAKWRAVFLRLGARQEGSFMLNNQLSSGDLSYSGNSRPMPAVRIGFVDFQDIPYTHGWLQICGVVEYAKPIDNDWVAEHYNYYNNQYTNGSIYHYKNIYFRTKPAERLSVTVGLQAAAQFSGTTYTYQNGVLISTNKQHLTLTRLVKMLVPHSDDRYYEGNHLGSLDLKARYRLTSGSEISAYFQWPWEDGSSLGKLNGMDGLWGVEFANTEGSWLKTIVVEYLQTTNQSGPIHWAPADNTGTTITSQATGYDNYYNNYQFNGYAYRGMSIGSPFLRSTIYNLWGQNQYLCNRIKGIHLGLNGSARHDLDYRLLLSWRKGWGTSQSPLLSPYTSTSAMIEGIYSFSSLKGLKLKGQIAFDAGSMYGDNFGLLATISYTGNLNLHRR